MNAAKLIAVIVSVTVTAVLGLYLYISSELIFLKIYTPKIAGIGRENKEVSVTIYAANSEIIYREYYRMSRKLDEDFELSKLIFIVEELIKQKRSNPTPEGIERWKLLLMKWQGLDPFSLKGVVLNHYADSLLDEYDLSGFRGEVVRWYTLAGLKNVYTENQLYKVFLDSPEYYKNVFGIAAASEYLFNKPMKNVTLLESAFLVGILSADKPLDPVKDYNTLDKYARVAVRKLYEAGRITNVEYRAEINGRVTLVPALNPVIEPSYVAEVMNAVKKDERFKIGEESLKIYTGLNIKATDIARLILEEQLRGSDKELQMAFVLLNRKTRAVEVAIGSRDPKSSRNRAFFLRRQMASTFKPIVYLTAFESGFRPSDTIVDKPYEFDSASNPYKPNNFESYFMGLIPLRYGLIYSLNNATVKLAELAGLGKVRRTALNLGMSSDIRAFYAMALGSFAATPLNVAQMYSTMANYGERSLPGVVLSVELDNGTVYDMRDSSKKVINSASAFQTLYIMQDVSRRGTARNAGMIPGTAAKTGTSDDFKDAWTVAVFGDYVASVWVGYDDYRPMGESGSGGRAAAPVIGKFQQAYLSGVDSYKLEPPEEVVFHRVRLKSGLRTLETGRGTYLEAFRVGNIPPMEDKPDDKDKKAKR